MEDRCICCGEIIPEGKQICRRCEHGGKYAVVSRNGYLIKKERYFTTWTSDIEHAQIFNSYAEAIATARKINADVKEIEDVSSWR